MALEDYNEVYKIQSNRSLRIVFCIYQTADNNHINRSLLQLQRELNRRLEEGANVEKAFVFHQKMVDVKDFSETDILKSYYADPCLEYSGVETKFSHIWHTGLVVLEKKKKEDEERKIDADYVLCLVMNRDPSRAEINKIMLSPRKWQVEYKPVVVKNRELQLEKTFEDYVVQKMGGKVVLDTQLGAE